MSAGQLTVVHERDVPMGALTTYDAHAHAAYLESKREIIRQICLPMDFRDDNVLLDLVIELGSLRGLNPVLKQMWVVPRGGKPSIEVSIDGARLIASRTGLCAGIDDPVFDVEGEKYPNRATCTVWRLVNGARYPFTATMRWSEFGKAGWEAKYDNLWKTKPYHMLGVRAEIHALRKAFPEETSGLSIEGESADAEGAPGAPEPPIRASGMLPSGLKEDQFARLEAEASAKGLTLTRGMTLAAMAEVIEAVGGPRLPGTVKAGDIWGAIKRIPQPPDEPPAPRGESRANPRPPRPTEPSPAPAAAEVPLEGQVREEKPEVDPETGEVIPSYVGQAALGPID